MKYPALFISLLTILACNNPSNKIEPQKESEVQPYNLNNNAQKEAWYILEDGLFNKISYPDEIESVEMLPWTVQARVSDLIVFNDSAVVAVNGSGISLINLNENIEFEYFYNKEIYQYKTITSLYPVNNTVLCHFYFNSTLNVTDLEAIKLVDTNNTINTMQYFFMDSPQPADIPFKKRNPDWEIVSMIPVNENTFFLEWKHLHNDIVNFRYSAFQLDTKLEELITRETYRNQYEYKDYRTIELETGIIKIINYIIDNIDISGDIHFLYETVEPPFQLKLKYINHLNPDINITNIKIVKNDNSISALLSAQKQILTIQAENVLDVHELPGLPNNFYYLDFISVNTSFIVSWEEIDFFNVGASGILIIYNQIL